MGALVRFERSARLLGVNRLGDVKIAAAILSVGGERALASAAGDPLCAMLGSGLGSAGRALAMRASPKAMAGLAALSALGEFVLDERSARASFERGAIDRAGYTAAIANHVGHAVGGLAGAFGGAAIGSALLPGLGSALGGLAGGLLGAAGGRELARAIVARLRALPARRRPAT